MVRLTWIKHHEDSKVNMVQKAMETAVEVAIREVGGKGNLI